jgi:dihydroorotate dehydrogenase (NAD+) catalytic subunit
VALVAESHRADRFDLEVELGDLQLLNPVMPASGCFGPELASLIPVARLGAVVTKTVFARPRSGNPASRLAETTGGMLNSVGIPSPSAATFIEELLPRYLALGPPVIVSVGGLAIRDYKEIALTLDNAPLSAIEVNVSCPNLEEGGLELGANPRAVERVVRDVVAASTRPVIAKLTPNVTAIADIAKASESGGACAVTVANTYVGLGIDHRTRSAVLGNRTGGLSGPAIKPLTLSKVWSTAHAVSIPVVGCGGICTAADVLEYLAAGASAVQIGTATFTRPQAMIEILDDLPCLLSEAGAASVGAYARRRPAP